MLLMVTLIEAQTSKLFIAPTVASKSCRNFDYTCGCSGWCNNCKHAGKDYCGSSSDNIVATGAGRIVYSSSLSDGSGGPKDNRGFGKTVVIAHKTSSGDVYSLYAHLSSIGSDIVVGKYVTKGYIIGKKGKTGKGANGEEHLHFEMKNHQGLGHNVDCTGEGCIGYVKSDLLPVSSRGYYNPNDYINVKEFNDIALETRMPTNISKKGLNQTLQINSPFKDNCIVDLRLGLYSKTKTFLGEIQILSNKKIVPGKQNITFIKSTPFISPVGQYLLQLDYKVPGSSTWIPMPVNGVAKNPGPTILGN